MIYPLCLRLFRKVDDTLASHYAGRKKLSEGEYSSGSYAMHDREKKKSKFVHPLSMRNATLSDSAESIVRAERVKDGRDILIVKESSVVVRPSTHTDEDDLSHYPGSEPRAVPMGNAATCNHSQQGSIKHQRPESEQWK